MEDSPSSQRLMLPKMPSNPVELERRTQSCIWRAIAFSLLALGQLIFALVFTYRFYIVSQNEALTLDSGWIFPPIAIVSCVVFALEAWRAVRPKNGAR